MKMGSQLERCLVSLALGSAVSMTCLGQASAARNNSQQPPNKEAVMLTEVQRRGLENLDRIALEARQIDNTAVRTELQSLIADALWDLDKAHARDIFRDAFKNARDIPDKAQATIAQTQVLQRL